VAVWVLTTRPSEVRADMAAAEALFREGRELLAAGKVAEACDKFDESERLDSSPGTLLNLARCHAMQGMTATAWAQFLAAKRAAEAAQRTDLAVEAQRQADALAKSLSYLTITAQTPPAGLEVTRNGQQVASTALGSKLPVDPGHYTIRARAPGYRDWSKEVTVEGAGAAETVVIPALEPAPGAAAAPAPPSQENEPAPLLLPPNAQAERGGAPVLGYVIGGFGVAATGVGLTFGALAQSKYSEAKKACPTLRDCSPGAMDARNAADTRANIANAATGIGLAAVATGVVLILTHHRGSQERTSTLSVSPSIGKGLAAAVIRGPL
jgi:hypothetical protein